MKKKEISKKAHFIANGDNSVLKTQLELEEFKISVSKLNIQMEKIEKELLSLKNNELPNFTEDVIVKIDEIKYHIDMSFSSQNLENKTNFNNFVNNVSDKIEKFTLDVRKTIKTYMGEINDTLSIISFTLANILEILKTKLSN